MYRYTLEDGSKKHLCPSCGRKTFVRVIDTITATYLPEVVGRCDRESNCGYQLTWSKYLRDTGLASQGRTITAGNIRRSAQHSETNLTAKTTGKLLGLRNKAETPLTDYSHKPRYESVDYLTPTHLLETIGSYERNSFAQFLMGLFRNDPSSVSTAFREYMIGTFDDWTSFPVISKYGKICKAKLMKFDRLTGKRLKCGDGRGLINSLQAKLIKAGRVKPDFRTDKSTFFGEHLLTRYPNWPIAIVESEKTAVIASICKGVFTDQIWLATGSKQWLKPERIARLGPEREIRLYPDADGYEQWRKVAWAAKLNGCRVKISSLIEKKATDTEKSGQFDIADYLVRDQRKRNDPVIQAAFAEMIEERLAIMMFDGGLLQEEAEIALEASGQIDHMIQAVLYTQDRKIHQFLKD